MKKGAKLDLKTIIPIILLICVLMYGAFAAVTLTVSEVRGNVTTTTGINVINQSTLLNFTITMTEIDADTFNISNVTFLIDASFLNFTEASNITDDGVSGTFFNASPFYPSGNISIFWNITVPGNPFNATFLFNVTPVSNVETRDTVIWLKIYNVTVGDDLLYDAAALTIDVDNKVPVVSFNIVNHTNSSTNVSVRFNFSVTDLNIQTCFLWVNSSGGAGTHEWKRALNGSGESLNGTGFLLNLSAGDGDYIWNVECNDTVGHWAFNATNFTITVDTVPPDYDLFNISSNLINLSINMTNLESDSSSTVAQGDTVYAYFNFTDATTGVYSATLQVYNTTLGTWMDQTTLLVSNLTEGDGTEDGSFLILHNTTYTFCNVADCYQSGRNVTLRVNASDFVGNTNVTRNLTVQVNDTITPRIDTITISGGGNGTNVSTTYISLNWTISELNNISWLSWSVDGAGSDTSGLRFYNYSSTFVVSLSDRDRLRGGSVLAGGNPGRIPAEGQPQLGNGTHNVMIRVMDSWGNMRSNNYSFTVDTTAPDNINLSFLKNLGDAPNTTAVPFNISLYGYANISVGFVGVSGLKKIQFNTSCNSTWKTISNNSVFQPFNESLADNNLSSCTDLDSVKDIMLNVTDFSDSSTIVTFTVGLDNVSPVITLDYIDGVAASLVEGYEFSGTNITINYTTPSEYTYLSSVGYYLDDGPYVQLNGGGTSIVDQTAAHWNVTNVTYGGKHTIKLQANDSVGNIRNSSKYTFYSVGLVDIDSKEKALETHLNNTHIAKVNITNGSNDILTYQTIDSSNPLAIRISLEVNTSQLNALNMTIEIINSSAIMWERINFSVTGYDSADIKTINDNYTASVERFVRFNGTGLYGDSSLDEFISDTNAYYGAVILPYNFTRDLKSVPMWFPNETGYSNMTLIIECAATNPGGNLPYTATRTNPCYNLTADGKTTLFVPHFSAVAVVNDTNASFIVINEPKSGVFLVQNTSTFYINLSVASDVRGSSSCAFKINASGYYNGAEKTFDTTWIAMAEPTGTIPKECVSLYPISLANGTTAIYNLTLNVTDAVGNQNITFHIFNVTDFLTPTWTNITNRSIDSTSAVIRVESNEYVNASVTYQSGSVARQSSPSPFTTKTPTISLSSLSASTLINYTVTVCDYAGNCNTSNKYNFTTSAAAATPSEVAATTGGGGGGATVAAATNIAAKQSQVWNKISAGESVTMSVSNDNIALTEIKVDVKNEVMSASLEASSLKDKPSETSSASSKVYQYLEIKPSNLVDADVSSAKVSFEVTTAWLTTNNVANDDITLLRYKNDKWNILDTKIVGTTPYKVKYEATTEGFSYYAIGTKSGVGITPEEAAAAEAAAEEAAATTTEEKEPIVTPPAANYMWLIVLIVVIIIALIYMLTKKKK